MPRQQPIDMSNSKYSMGTTPVFNKLLELVQGHRNPVEIVMFNVSTILRNCANNESVVKILQHEKETGVETDKPAQQLLVEARNELELFMGEIVQMLQDATHVQSPTLVDYFCDYQKIIPNSYYRQMSHGKRAMCIAEQMLLASMTRKQLKRTVGRVTIFEVPVLGGIQPHVALSKILGGIPNDHGIVQITNHPLDYHICKYTSSYRLLQSFTGEVYTKDMLAQKVFGTDALPFNTCTHAVLGDTTDIKSSISPSTKKKLFEIASNEHWGIHTVEWTKERLYDVGVRIPFNI